LILGMTIFVGQPAGSLTFTVWCVFFLGAECVFFAAVWVFFFATLTCVECGDEGPAATAALTGRTPQAMARRTIRSMDR
jgi:hypothetical protein